MIVFVVDKVRQDNYTLAQPGIQTKIIQLKDLMKRLDGKQWVVWLVECCT